MQVWSLHYPKKGPLLHVYKVICQANPSCSLSCEVKKKGPCLLEEAVVLKLCPGKEALPAYVLCFFPGSIASSRHFQARHTFNSEYTSGGST